MMDTESCKGTSNIRCYSRILFFVILDPYLGVECYGNF